MTRRRRRSWTVDQKQSLVAEIIDRTCAGESFSQAARVHESTPRQWVRKLSPRSLQPVALLEAAETRRPGPTATISLAAPGDLRPSARHRERGGALRYGGSLFRCWLGGRLLPPTSSTCPRSENAKHVNVE